MHSLPKMWKKAGNMQGLLEAAHFANDKTCCSWNSTCTTRSSAVRSWTLNAQHMTTAALRSKQHCTSSNCAFAVSCPATSEAANAPNLIARSVFNSLNASQICKTHAQILDTTCVYIFQFFEHSAGYALQPWKCPVAEEQWGLFSSSAEHL